MEDATAWNSFDDDVSMILATTLQGSAEKRITSLGNLIYNIGKERFGIEEKKTPRTNKLTVNRRERRIKECREELKKLNKQFKRSTEEEKMEIVILTDDIRGELIKLRRAERYRKLKKQRTREKAKFVKDPFRFTKELLGKERSGTLKCSKEEVEKYLEVTHSNPQRGEDLGPCPRNIEVEPPGEELDCREPTWKEVVTVVKKARSGSAPGPNGVTYKVYKKCPKILRKLWELHRVIWRKAKFPEAWQQAEGCFVPKEKDSKNIDQFRTISLLNVEGKIFMAVLAKRLSEYMVKNKYINTSIQKAGIQGFSGCLEHTVS